MANLLYSLRNSELSQVAVELGECVPPGLHKKGLIDLIQNSTSYEVQLIQSILIDIKEEREERMRLRNAEWERQDRLIAAERELILKNLRLKIELENRKKGIKVVETFHVKDVPLKSDLDIPNNNLVREESTSVCEVESRNKCENVSPSNFEDVSLSNTCEDVSPSKFEDVSLRNFEESKIICPDNNQQTNNMEFVDGAVEPKEEIMNENLICFGKTVELNLGSARDIFMDNIIEPKINLAPLNVLQNGSCIKIGLDETFPQNSFRDSELPQERAEPPIATLKVTPGDETNDLEKADSNSEGKVAPYDIEKPKPNDACMKIVGKGLSCFEGPIVGDELLTEPGSSVLEKDTPSCVLKRLGMGQLKGLDNQVKKGRERCSLIVVVAVIPGIVKRRKSGMFHLISMLGERGDHSRKLTNENCQNFWNPEGKDILVMGFLGVPMGIG